MIQFPDSGSLWTLKKAFQGWSPSGDNYKLKLFTNDVDVSDALTLNDFTVASGGGYYDKTIDAYGFIAEVVGGIAQISYERQTWVFTGALTGAVPIYGYLIADNDSSPNLICYEKLDTPFYPEKLGDSIYIDLVLSASKGTPT